MPQRRRCVERPNLAVNRVDLNYEMSDLRNRIGHAHHLVGEPVRLEPVHAPPTYGDLLRAPSAGQPACQAASIKRSRLKPASSIARRPDFGLNARPLLS